MVVSFRLKRSALLASERSSEGKDPEMFRVGQCLKIIQRGCPGWSKVEVRPVWLNTSRVRFEQTPKTWKAANGGAKRYRAIFFWGGGNVP